MVEMELANLMVLMLILAGWVAVSLKWWLMAEGGLMRVRMNNRDVSVAGKNGGYRFTGFQQTERCSLTTGGIIPLTGSTSLPCSCMGRKSLTR